MTTESNASTSPSPAQMYEHSFVPAIFVPWTRVMLESAKPRTGETVLDLACGTGIVARTVAPLVGGSGEVIGVDVSEDMLAVASEIGRRERLPIDWYRADACDLPLASDSVDLIICQQGIQFFGDSARAATEMHRVLKEDGRAVVSVWQDLENQPVYKALLEAEADYVGVPVTEVATPFTYGDAERLRDELERADFDRIEISQEVREVSFDEPDRFVAMTLMAGAALFPESSNDGSKRYELIGAISARAEATLQRYRRNGTLTFPMHSYLAVAHK